MSVLLTKEEVEAARVVDRIRDHVAEAKRRWPDLTFSVAATSLGREVFGRWTTPEDGGVKRALRLRVEDAGSVEEAERLIARSALFNAEVRALTGGRK